jgi:hypothetical protein
MFLYGLLTGILISPVVFAGLKWCYKEFNKLLTKGDK